MAEPGCSLCGRSPREHREAETQGVVHHQYTTEDGGLTPVKGELKPKETQKIKVVTDGLPGDPVLRTILIEKGVITLEDIEKAERTLKATGVFRNHAGPPG